MTERRTEIDKNSPATILQDKVITGVKESIDKGHDAFVNGPTGTGKTRIFTEVAGHYAKQNKNIIVMAGRINLVLQAHRNMEKWVGDHIPTSVGYNGQIDQSGNVVYTTIQTAQELKNDLKKYDIAIIDEAHHALEKNSDYTQTIEALIKKNPSILLIPASATPPEGYEGLHPRIKNADKHIITFEEALQASLVRLPETITPPMIYTDHTRIENLVSAYRKNATSAEMITGIGSALKNKRGDDWPEQLVSICDRHLKGKKTLAFFDSIKEANAFVNEAKLQGYSVAAIHSKQSLNENQRIKDLFERRKISIMASVDMISEGYDIECEAVLLDKRTTSLMEYKQIIGRESRGYGQSDGQRPLLIDTGASTHIHGNIAAIAQVNTSQSNIERGTSSKERLLPDVETDQWKPWVRVSTEKSKHEIWATSLGNSIVYAAKIKTGYAAITSVKDKKGSRVDLLDIEGQKKGRPSAAAMSDWMASAIQKSGKNLATLVGRRINGKTELEQIIANDWNRNSGSVERYVEMLSPSPQVINKAIMMTQGQAGI